VRKQIQDRRSRDRRRYCPLCSRSQELEKKNNEQNNGIEIKEKKNNEQNNGIEIKEIE